MKPYKDDTPVNTVKKIKKILSKLNIETEEYHYNTNGLFGSTIKISNDGLGLLTKHISTNGKGKSFEYSLASAYGEFMERLQNGILINQQQYALKKNLLPNQFSHKLKKTKGDLDFMYDPKEEIYKIDKYIEDNYIFLSELLQIKEIKTLKEIIKKDLNFYNFRCVPFLNINDKCLTYLPIELLFKLVGSNGMCAGNTREEAIIQGICEVFERYAMKELYDKKITPPTIPKKVFNKFPIIDKIKELEQEGLEITIKDLSLGKNLPVLGLLIVDKNNHLYNFKAASNVRPEIALERCLTEFHQTSDTIKLIKIKGWKNTKENKYENILNFRKIIYNSSGHHKKEIFDVKPSFKFTPLNFNLGKSHKEDLTFLKNIISKMKTSIYIRDVSFLGFHSYYVIIPKLSKIKYLNTNDYKLYNNFETIEENFLNIKNLKKNKFKSLAKFIEKWHLINPNFWNDIVVPVFLPHINNDTSYLEVNLFLSFSFYKLKKLKKAEYYITQFLNGYKKEVSSFLYFYAFRDFLRLKIDNTKINDIELILNKLYNNDLVQEILRDFKKPKDVFSILKFPSCRHCENCEVLNSCKYFDVMKILKNIQNEQKKYKTIEFSI